MTGQVFQELFFKDRQEWETWLEKHHDSESGIWMIYYKKHTNNPCIDYDEAVKTALCYGWIDSIIKAVDDDIYLRKFTPRNDTSAWSEPNKRRVQEMISLGKMKAPGYEKIEKAKENGKWAGEKIPDFSRAESAEFLSALEENPAARSFYESLTPLARKPFILWVNTAKKEETRQKRIHESIELLSHQKKLGLK